MTPGQVANVVTELGRLRPADVEQDPALHRQLEQLAETIDHLRWPMTGGAPEFRV